MVSVWSVCPRHAFRPGLHVLVTADHRRSPFASTLPVACTMQVVWVEHQGGMNRVNGNPARHARALYSPVPTLATSLAPEENLFGLMGSLAFEQRARPTGTALNHLTGAWRGKGETRVGTFAYGGVWYGEKGRGGGRLAKRSQPGPKPGRRRPPGCAIMEQGLPAMPCETRAAPDHMSLKSPHTQGPRPSRLLPDLLFCPIIELAGCAGRVETPVRRGVDVRGTP